MFAAILAFLQAFPTIVNLIDRAVTAYETNLKIQWAQALQAGLQPIENGPSTDAQKAAAAKAVADAIAKLS